MILQAKVVTEIAVYRYKEMAMSSRNDKGFTLIELMITVAIIGILVAVAIPSFARYKLKSRTAEASVNLEAIATIEIAYHAEYNQFVVCAESPPEADIGILKTPWTNSTGFTLIGFSPKDNSVHYSYEVTSTDTAVNFTAEAEGDLDGDGNNAVFLITNSTPVSQSGATIGYY